MAIINHLLDGDDEGLAGVGQQPPMEFDDRDDPNGEVDYVPPLRVGGRLKQRAQKKKTCKKKRIWPTAGSKSAESSCDDPDGKDDYVPVECKRRWPAAGSKFAKSDKDFVSTRKRGRPAGTKTAKSKMLQKPTWSRRRKDDNFDLMVPSLKIASDVQKKLTGGYPSFTKLMLKSHVVEHFWLGLPSDFCTSHLPKNDVVIKLENEHRQSYDVNYLGARKGLSGGWVSFAKKHNLEVGDALVFELVELTKFKVYIIKEKDLITTNGDFKSKEDTEVIGASSSTRDDDGSNLASEEAAGDVDSKRSPVDLHNGFNDATSFTKI